MSNYTKLRDAITAAIENDDQVNLAGIKVRPWSFRVINIDQSANVEIQLAVSAEPSNERRRCVKPSGRAGSRCQLIEGHAGECMG